MAAAIIAIAYGYPPSNHGVPGPGMFPIIIAGVMLAAAAVLAIETLRSASDENVDLRSRNVLTVYITMAGFIAYLVLLPRIGFVTTTAAMLTIFMRWFSGKAWWKVILTACVFTLAIYFLFGSVLKVPMRFGLLL